MKQRMLYLRKTPVQSAFIIYLLALGLILFPSNWLGELFFKDEKMAELFGFGVMRVIMGVIMLLIALNTGFKNCILPRSAKGTFFALPALLVAVNNLPIIALARGDASIIYGGEFIAVFALECLAVGFFEEITFRGIVFPLILQKTGTSIKGRLQAIIFSSALFGFLHIINLLNGFSSAVFLQMGYSFLIGAMLSVVMFKGGGVITCAFIHGVYNFCGMIVSELGTGSFFDIWNVPEIILTAVVAVAVIVYCVLITIKSSDENGLKLIEYNNQDKNV